MDFRMPLKEMGGAADILIKSLKKHEMRIVLFAIDKSIYLGYINNNFIFLQEEEYAKTDIHSETSLQATGAMFRKIMGHGRGMSLSS